MHLGKLTIITGLAIEAWLLVALGLAGAYGLISALIG